MKSDDTLRITFQVTPKPILAAAVPSLCMLLLFYSLAVHMRLSLGDRPASMGSNGFSQALKWHAELTWHLASYIYAASLFLLPPAILVCLVKAPWRRYAVYLGLHGVLFLAAYGIMQLAPGRFLAWWWD
jgi:hypothetical protein